ncbi:PBP superfamily domain-containing protein [Luteibacter sp. UNCMF331Sha3.1]|uniref:PstS family phosphate ABC transporter substrate-binding protein n=1 Tax=Luteibacter sp. UNCMF331Sha3.1 TaxID=1502760 RepID=UPI0008B75E82|nr:substrate-binding domain-containing protein [Luteibacter sp. UNCMF331Sha3.1]SEN07299.1 PBP superfamily domain-containing protein [Luteibacter sp. UNCMF331Sha3.1]
MFKRNAMGNTRTKLVAGAVMLVLGLSVAGSALATDTFGGGATLPAGGYVGFNFLTGSLKQSANTASPTSGVAPVLGTSLFGAWATASGNKVSYCQTGSGNGKKIFDNWDGAASVSAIGACGGGLTGFGAPSSILVNPHFAGSDAPMSATEYGSFTSGGKVAQYGEPVQFPAVAGSIAVIYHKSGLSTQLNLTSAQVCGVFNGTITQWSTLTGNASDTSAIKVAFRSDGSGTSFSLANHMNAACAGTSSQHFIVDQSFATAISQYKPTIPSTWVGASGNQGVVQAVQDNDNTIGYAESANLKASALAGGATDVKYATIGGKDPYADFPTAVAVLPTNDFVLGAVDASTGRPAVTALTPIGQKTCMVLVNPLGYANITSRYPIMAVSYLIANNKGNTATDVAAVRGLVGAAYDTSLRSSITTIGAIDPVTGKPNTGYAFLTASTLTQAKVDSCIAQ